MSIEDPTISNMWEIAAIVELLERQGLSTEQDLHTTIDELCRKNPLFAARDPRHARAQRKMPLSLTLLRQYHNP